MVFEEDPMPGIEELFQASETPADFTGGYLRYLASLAERLDKDAISRIIASFVESGDSGRTIYFIGNGGAAATATHWASDMAVGVRAGGEPWLNAVSLTDNFALITTLANDFGYEEIFVRQLQNMLQSGDVVMAFSVSGDSENVLRAIEYANKVGATTIGFTGFSGGRLRGLVDISLHAPTPLNEFGPVEDLFQIVDHLVTSYLILMRHGRLGR